MVGSLAVDCTALDHAAQEPVDFCPLHFGRDANVTAAARRPGKDAPRDRSKIVP